MESWNYRLKTNISHTTHMVWRRKRFPTSIVLAVAAAMLAIGLVSQTSPPASAASAPVVQCNNDTASNVGGQGIACTVTIVNYVTGTGTIAATAPSTVTVTRCTGAAGPIGAGAGTCATTTTTSAEPVTLVQQCNGSGNGGGGVVKCTVTVTNHFSTSPSVAPTPAAVYQCIGSFDTSAVGTCTPANTPGITSVTAATVGQCNGSGNGGGTSYTCTVTGTSTMTTALPVNVDQCNGSGNGGGALVICTATVTNDVVPASASATPTATATGSATATATGSATATATGSATATATGSATATPTGPATATATGPATATPTGPATGTPVVGSPPAPRPPATGNAGFAEPAETSQAVLWLLAVATLGVTMGLALAGRRRMRL